MLQSLNAFQAFNVVFQKALEKAVPAAEVSARVVNLIDCITYSVFMYTSRGLFERDKLIFSSQMAFQASPFIVKRIIK
jgi:dynein heavy chain